MNIFGEGNVFIHTVCWNTLIWRWTPCPLAKNGSHRMADGDVASVPNSVPTSCEPGNIGLCDLLLVSHETATGSWWVRARTGAIGQSRGDGVCAFTEMHHLWRGTTFSVEGLKGLGYCPIPRPRCVCLHAPHKQMINDLIRNWPPYCVYHNCITINISVCW